MMVRFPLACLLVALPGLTAQAGMEVAFASAGRVSTNYNTPPAAGGPTYSLVTTYSGTGLSPLSANVDLRGTGYFSDSEIKFALPPSSAFPGQSVVAAQLTFNVQASQTTPSSTGPVLTVSGFAANLNSASLADFSLPVTTLASTPALGNTGLESPTLPPFTFDVTSFLRNLQSTGTTAVGFRFDVTGGSVFINAPNDPNQALQPILTVTFGAAVPEPASAALMALGLTIPLALSRRTLTKVASI